MSHEQAAEDLRREAATFAALRIQPVFPASVAEEIAKSARSWTAIADSMSADLARRAAAMSAIQLPDLTALTEAMNRNLVESIAPMRANLDQLAAHVAQVVDFDKTYSAITAQIAADFQLRMPVMALQPSAIATLRADALSAVDALASEDDRQLFGEMLASVEVEVSTEPAETPQDPLRVLTVVMAIVTLVGVIENPEGSGLADAVRVLRYLLALLARYLTLGVPGTH